MLGGRARGGLWVGAGRRGDSHVWFAEGGFDGRSARSTAAMSSQPGKGGAKGPMINTALAYVYAPLRPLLHRLNITRVLADGSLEDVVTGLPWGDHMPSYPIVGPDGRIYFTTGSATNCGVVGADNYAYGWLRHFHSMCDVPGQDVTLVGTNSSSRTSSATSGRRCGAVPS